MMGLIKNSVLSVEFNVSLSLEELPALKEVIGNNLGLSGWNFRRKESEGITLSNPVFQYKNVEGKTCLLCYGVQMLVLE